MENKVHNYRKLCTRNTCLGRTLSVRMMKAMGNNNVREALCIYKSSGLYFRKIMGNRFIMTYEDALYNYKFTPVLLVYQLLIHRYTNGNRLIFD